VGLAGRTSRNGYRRSTRHSQCGRPG
jgi:hypothetical protein